MEILTFRLIDWLERSSLVTEQPVDWIELPVEWIHAVGVVVLLLGHGGCDEIAIQCVKVMIRLQCNV